MKKTMTTEGRIRAPSLGSALKFWIRDLNEMPNSHATAGPRIDVHGQAVICSHHVINWHLQTLTEQ